MKYLLFWFLLLFHLNSNSQLVYHTDVLIVGGGTSGISAGLQSARMGIQTLIVEESNWLGGMITASGVSAFDGNHNIPSGIWREFRERIYQHYGGPEKVATGWVSNTHFEPHIGDSILKKMASQEKNLKILFSKRFLRVLKTGDRISGAFFRDEISGEEIKVYAKAIIEATELGDVIKSAGLEYDLGMEAGILADEDVGVNQSYPFVQDLTFVAILKDFGNGTDHTIPKPQDYNPNEFDGSCTDFFKDPSRAAPNVNAQKMLDYARLPGNKYMLNWPKYGNDIYLNIIEMTHDQRLKELEKAKQQTLRFIYFIQDQLGFKNLGLAEDEFPTEDKLAINPYHRESRRIRGLVRYNMKYLSKPYTYKEPLYRTGIAVGDYPVDHHHKKNPSAPQHLEFYPIPSFNIPLGTLIPQKGNGLVVAEKSISVSNVINGATRLQPCVMLIGQAAGVLAALSVKLHMNVREVQVRSVQAELIKSNAMLMPYIDAIPGSPFFQSIQRIGATGILKGTGIPKNWANQTWFYPNAEVDTDTLKINLKDFDILVDTDENKLTVQSAINLIKGIYSNNNLYLNQRIIKDITVFVEQEWNNWGLKSYDTHRKITRGELAVLLDKTIHPFELFSVDHFGRLKK